MHLVQDNLPYTWLCLPGVAKNLYSLPLVYPTQAACWVGWWVLCSMPCLGCGLVALTTAPIIRALYRLLSLCSSANKWGFNLSHVHSDSDVKFYLLSKTLPAQVLGLL